MLDETKLHKAVGKNIKVWRQELRIKQSEVAERIGLTRTSISNIETGVQNATLSVIYKLCQEFDLTLGDILPNPNQVVLQKVKTSNSNNQEIGEKVSAVLKKVRSSEKR